MQGYDAGAKAFGIMKVLLCTTLFSCGKYIRIKGKNDGRNDGIFTD